MSNNNNDNEPNVIVVDEGNGPLKESTNQVPKRDHKDEEKKASAFRWSKRDDLLFIQEVDKLSAHIAKQPHIANKWKEVEEEMAIHGIHLVARTFQKRFDTLRKKFRKMSPDELAFLDEDEETTKDLLDDMELEIKAKEDMEQLEKKRKASETDLTAAGKRLRDKTAMSVLAGEAYRVGGDELKLGEDGSIQGSQMSLEPTGELMVQLSPGGAKIPLSALTNNDDDEKKGKGGKGGNDTRTTAKDLARTILDEQKEKTDKAHELTLKKLELETKKIELETQKLEADREDSKRRFDIEMKHLQQAEVANQTKLLELEAMIKGKKKSED